MDPLAQLRLLQLFDSQFPVGAFAHSGGLETYAATGGGLRELHEILVAQIAFGWGRAELAAASLAWRAENVSSVSALARLFDAHKTIPSTRHTSVRLGRRFLTLLQRLHPEQCAGFEIDPPHHAVAIGAISRRLGIELGPMLIAFAQSLATATVGAAMRCMPVSPAQAQELVRDVQPALARAAALAEHATEERLLTSTPSLDIRAHQQAFLPTRLFQS